MEAIPADPVSESPGVQRPLEESTADADELGGRERLASVADEPMAMPRAMVGTTRSSDVDAGVVDAASESGAEKPMVPEEQTMLPEVSEGVVGHAVRPLSPLVVPPATEEEDKVEEIKREESWPKLSESSANMATRWWLLRRRTLARS